MHGLLPYSVPDLQHDSALVDGNLLSDEFNADGGGGVFVVDRVLESLEETGLADSAVADHNHFEHVVVVLHSLYCFF